MQNDETKKTKSAPKLLIITSVLMILSVLGILVFFAIRSQIVNPNIRINNQVLDIKIAMTSQEKTQGLCCRDSLPVNQAMLFVYDRPGNYPFWMKDTRIALDMIWISSDKKIVHIEHNVQPASYPTSYTSKIPAQYILETN